MTQRNCVIYCYKIHMALLQIFLLAKRYSTILKSLFLTKRGLFSCLLRPQISTKTSYLLKVQLNVHYYVLLKMFLFLNNTNTNFLVILYLLYKMCFKINWHLWSTLSILGIVYQLLYLIFIITLRIVTIIFHTFQMTQSRFTVKELT